jgi:hypothetical protein
MMEHKLYYQSDKLVERINWDVIMDLPRCAGGHDEIMMNLLKDVELIAHWHSGGWSGSVATCVKLNDTGEVVIYNDYYGSCSGCDIWDGASDDETKDMCRRLAAGAYIFKDEEDCIKFLESQDVDGYTYNWLVCRKPMVETIKW